MWRFVWAAVISLGLSSLHVAYAQTGDAEKSILGIGANCWCNITCSGEGGNKKLIARNESGYIQGVPGSMKNCENFCKSQIKADVVRDALSGTALCGTAICSAEYKVGTKDPKFISSRNISLKSCGNGPSNGGNGPTPSVSALDHFVCYKVKPVETTRRTVKIDNQFKKGEVLYVFDAELLCVPSQKTPTGCPFAGVCALTK